MKPIIKMVSVMVVVAFIFSSCASSNYVTQSNYQEQGSPVTYQSFYDNLSPYGNWLNYPGYGNVWNPNVGAGFRPYATNGQWRYSNDGWAWQSNYNWGWAPFHYGRWLYDDNYGWLWVPGYDWSPAWVTWGSVNNYYAWAPLVPEVNVGVQYNSWRPHPAYWNMVPREHIYDRNVNNVIVRNNNHSNNTNITNITIINNYNNSRTNNYYAKGPEVGEVQRFTKNKIEPVTFKEVNHINKPNQNSNVIDVYRPVVQNPHPENNNNASQNNITRPGNNNSNPQNLTQPNNNNNGIIRDNKSGNTQPALHPENTDTRRDIKLAPPLQPANNNGLPAGTENGLPRDNNGNNNAQQQRPPHPENTEPRRDIKPAPPLQPANNNGTLRDNNNGNNNVQPQRPAEQPVHNAQPRVFKTVGPAQTRPLRNESQAPVMQPRQQMRNVRDLPVQHAPQAAPANNGGGGIKRGERE